MLNKKKIIKIFKKDIQHINNIQDINKIKIKYLGKTGFINEIKKILQKSPKNLKPKIGKTFNYIKKYFQNKILYLKKKIYKKNLNSIHNTIIEDISLPCNNYLSYGNLHPITITLNKIEKFFKNLGFTYFYSSEIENTYFNFEALNINKKHPSYTKKDTFWINKKLLLRTQTSPAQIRYMLKKKPPLKIITSGCVFRKDDDTTHTPMFHQLEGFLVDKNISFANLKYLITQFIYFLLNKKKIEFIPSYFPFTEPSAEVVIKNNHKWLEVLGCGMIHPKIFENVNINSKKYSGFAFGLGIERLTMLKYNIKNIKFLYKNNIRFLNQF